MVFFPKIKRSRDAVSFQAALSNRPNKLQQRIEIKALKISALDEGFMRGKERERKASESSRERERERRGQRG